MSNEQKPKHDGMLDEGDAYSTGPHVRLRLSGYIKIDDEYGDHVELSPKQALSLLAWLFQEQETLERLTQEQHNG